MRTRSGAPTWLARDTDQMKPGSGVDTVEDKGREKVYRSKHKFLTRVRSSSK